MSARRSTAGRDGETLIAAVVAKPVHTVTPSIGAGFGGSHARLPIAKECR
jgi:hypothetical protein